MSRTANLDKPATLQSVNAALARLGFDEDELVLVRGEGYHYVAGTASNTSAESIYLVHTRHQTARAWLHDVLDRVEEEQEERVVEARSILDAM